MSKKDGDAIKSLLKISVNADIEEEAKEDKGPNPFRKKGDKRDRTNLDDQAL